MSNVSVAIFVASVCACPASLGLADDVANASLWGSYSLESVSDSDMVVSQAVDKATDELNVFVRGIARRRLKEINPAYRHIALSKREGEISSDFDGLYYVASADGKVRKNVEPDGGRVDVTFRFDGHTLHALYKAKDGEKSVDYVLRPDGKTLDVRVHVSSPHLPEPFSYGLTYHVGS